MDKRVVNEKYAEIGADLIASEESLAHLRDSDASIVYLSSEHKKVTGGNLVFGQCEKIAEKYKWGIPCDFTITVFEPNVEEYQFTDEQIRALIHHELLHVGTEWADDGTEKYFIVPHDLEDFKLILERYGINWCTPNQ